MINIPKYLLDAYSYIPTDRPVSVLMRHSIRYPITNDNEILTAGLTPEGIDLAKEVGNFLSTRFTFGEFVSSPIARCLDTANLIAVGAGRVNQKAEPVHVLGHPQIQEEYDVIETFLDGELWGSNTHEIASYLIPNGHHKNGLNFFLSHDTVIVLMAAFWLNLDLRSHEDWPKFLEPFFLWWNDEHRLVASFRGEESIIHNIYLERAAQLIQKA